MDRRVDLITMISISLCALDTIHHTAFNKTGKCTSLHARKQPLKPLTRTLPSMLASTLPIALADTLSRLDYMLPRKVSKR